MPKKPVVIKRDGLWILQIEKENGKIQEFRCATEAQARQLALVMAGTAAQPPA
jgi:hypothetical protein